MHALRSRYSIYLKRGGCSRVKSIVSYWIDGMLSATIFLLGIIAIHLGFPLLMIGLLLRYVFVLLLLDRGS